MNAKDLRKYWFQKCNEKNLEYKTEKFIIELTLLKKLLTKYDDVVILEAMDRFFDGAAKPLSIPFFATSKIFDEKYSDIAKLAPILKYKRALMSMPMKQRDEANELIKDFLIYSNSFNLSDYEKEEKNKIPGKLEAIWKGISDGSNSII